LAASHRETAAELQLSHKDLFNFTCLSCLRTSDHTYGLITQFQKYSEANAFGGINEKPKKKKKKKSKTSPNTLSAFYYKLHPVSSGDYTA